MNPQTLSRRAPRISATARAAAALIAGLASMGAWAQAADSADEPRAKDDNVRIGTIVITGRGDRLGAGQILNEDAVKARSTVTRAATEKDRATGNPFQALSLLPGVNTYSHDATGLFGGSISVRGFGGDQLGLTINGVPVNDSGNYAVFPQEYVDQENLCTQSVAQGNPDVESPHIGASGGSINIVSCDPEDKRRYRISQTLGGLGLTRTFLRGDSGLFMDGKAKVFLSVSHTEADKWKGQGGAKRDHIDGAFSLNLGDARIVGSILYNKALNNNFGTMTLAQLNSRGYFYDFSTVFTPGHVTGVNGTAQTEVGPSPQFYKLAQNPFENAIASVSASFRLSDATYLKVQPYFWYGYGTGGIQQQVQSESAFYNSATGTLTARVDLNGDGDTLDRVIVANSSVTRTRRPGVTAEVSHVWGNHQFKAGLWYERAQHRQTGPSVAVDAEGNPSDIWLRSGWILRPDGSPRESRDWLTISPAYQVYFADTINVMGDKGVVQLGLRAPHITRKFTNYPSEAGGASLVGYTFEKSYSDVLPQVGFRYNLNKEQQVFANIGKNFRAPPNFAFAPTNNNIAIVSGVPTLVGDVKAETAVTLDAGFRHQSKDLTLSGTVFYVDFSNRQSNAFDTTILKSIYTNVGKSMKRGLELEAGTPVWNGFTAYASLTLQKETLKDNLVLANGTLPLRGKQYTLTPTKMAALSVQYAQGPFYARFKGKYTGGQYATLMNDELVPSYVTADVDLGYKFADMAMFKNPTVRMNISNIGNAKYRNPSSGSVNNAVTYGTITGSAPTYYLGAPRLVSLSLSADFQ